MGYRAVHLRYQITKERKQKGMVLPFLLCLWLPLFSLLIGSIWIQIRSAYWIQGQKALDRCVFQVQARRCSGLSSLSKINKKLRQVIQAGSAAAALQTLPPLAPASRVALQSLKTLAQFLAKTQDLILLKDRGLTAAFFKCGLPTPETLSYHLEAQVTRAPHIEAQLLKMPAPLTWQWQKGPLKVIAPFQVYSWKGREFHSFGSCGSGEAARLQGEDYDASFVNARISRVKSFLNWY